MKNSAQLMTILVSVLFLMGNQCSTTSKQSTVSGGKIVPMEDCVLPDKRVVKSTNCNQRIGEWRQLKAEAEQREADKIKTKMKLGEGAVTTAPRGHLELCDKSPNHILCKED